MTVAYDFDRFPILETPRLILRQVEEEDVQRLLSIFGDPLVVRYLSEADAPLNSYEGAYAIYDWMCRTFASKRGVRWGLSLKDDPSRTLLGTAGFHLYDAANRNAEVGYELAQAYWRRGLMHEAVQRILRFCFDDMDMHRIGADVTEGNEASAGLLLKLGFQREGAFREKVWSGGQFRDLWLFSLLRREFRTGGQ
ncbi:MAG: GNAT family N-acetyltransferase [Anaerolineae bacterium]|nr:GNAT family N-acetyltransferase [Anaerolineae bacterium]